MRLPTPEPETPDINLTPLIDVVFLMLVFFVVTTHFIDERALPVTLPAGEADPLAESAPIVVSITEAGGIRVDDRAVGNTAAALREALSAALAARPEGVGSVLLRADRSARHGVVTRVMEQAGQLGVSRISIATTTPAAAP